MGYDAQGNLANKSGQLFDFDYGNRLREAVDKERYVYDGHGRRVQAIHPTLGTIYSMYGQDGALRFQRDERKGTAIDYITLNGSLVARVRNEVAPPVPMLTAPGYDTDGSYTVSWNGVANATSYELQERDTGGSWVQVQSSSATSRAVSAKISGIYDYRVRACNAECGGWSAEATVAVELPPDGVPNLVAPETALNGNYTVSWSAPGGAETYDLQEKKGSGAWVFAYQGTANSTSYSGKEAGSYGYRVRACNPADCTSYSETDTVQVIVPPTEKPTVTVPGESTTGGYTVSWTAVATATHYVLEQRIGSGAWSAFGANAATSKALSEQASGTYQYRVKGCNLAGCGPVSDPDTIVVLTPPTSAPSLTVPETNSTGTYTVSWTTVGTATSYQIEESVDGTNWPAIYDGDGTSKAITHTSGSYTYRGRACNTSGCGSYSPAKTIVVKTTPVTPAFRWSIKHMRYVGSDIHIRCEVAWTTVAAATWYEMKAYGGDLQYSGPLTSVEGAQNTATYCAPSQIVRACNGVGCSPWSTPPYPQITKVFGTPGDGGVEP